MQPDTSGHAGFDAFVAERFARKDHKIKLLPDPMGGRFTQSMTPEQAEYLARTLLVLSSAARKARGEMYPGLYPDDV